MHSVHSRSTQRREMLLCYREGFLKLCLQFHLGSLPVHLTGGQGKNTEHPSGSIEGRVQHGLSPLHFLCLEHHHHNPNQLCLDLLKHTGSPHRPQRGKKIPVFTLRAQRGVWKVNFACWPTGLEVTAGQLLKGSQLTTQALAGGREGTISSYSWIDSAAFATSKPLQHSRGAPSPLKPYPFHSNFCK